MAQSLVIVESTAKTRTINKILGGNYLVKASIGHIKDLPKKQLGVDIENRFEPEYLLIDGKKKVVLKLRELAAKADAVYLATDPDREGEAIAYHIAEELQSKNRHLHRVLFNEITPTAVKQAIEQPTRIDMSKVEAQKARRVMDRLVGYQVSPILWKTIYYGDLSAGRVQSVALRLICEREADIEVFVSQEYWSITAYLQGENTEPFFTKLLKIDGKPTQISNESTAKYYVEDIEKKPFVVAEIKKKDVQRKPSPPFTTSTLQQEAARRFGFSAQRIMAIAQQLYEGIELGEKGSVGLITYMRTDSTRISEEALLQAREYVGVNYGMEYLPDKPQRYKVKASAQDAHEAIRPTSTKREPKKIRKHLTSDQQKLYGLIWNGFLASQMKPAVYEQTTIDITADEYLFRTTGSVIKFRGFLVVYGDFEEENNNKDEEDGNGYIPTNLTIGEQLRLLELLPRQHFTKPPARYTESSLVKELDNLGIGRPSTYATIISTLFNRKYVDRQTRQLAPTELGRTVNTILVEHFPGIFNVEFTAQMESQLDRVETGKKSSLEVLQDFYVPFNQALQRVDSQKAEIKQSLLKNTGEKCPECGKDLVIKWGRNGKFMACSSYPDCRYTRQIEEEQVEVEIVCNLCGSPMVVKTGRFGRFLACSAYPKCKNTKPLGIGVPCPRENCDGEIVEKRTRRGKVFYGCSRYPTCDFATWNRPVNQPCPQCQNSYLELRTTKAKGEFLRCPQCKAEYPVTTSEASVPGRSKPNR